jgi:hypothetical protein
VQHFSCHEGAQIVQPKRPKPGGDEVPLESEDLRGGLVEFDCMAAFGLGVSKHGSGWAFHPSVGECHLSELQVDVPPSKPEQLGAAGPGSRREHHERARGIDKTKMLEE